MNYFKYYLITVLTILLFSCENSKISSQNDEYMYTNSLIKETSPYLLQHAHNPVDWYAWNDETLQKAKEEDKLLLISIGYAACHWCHVMEHESFEDTTVAKIMNENFINIKIDREERPDIDQIYMDACQIISGNGGWPLNAIALPDGRPIYAGTYFPKENWMKLLNYFADYYPENKAEAIEQAEQIVAGINGNETFTFNTEKQDFTSEQLDKVWENWRSKLDFKNGGRTGAPKFPMPNNWDFLLRYYYFSENEEVLKAVETTLDKMAQGGIYDHVGGGFARYSTDGIWKVPHFEKMLYDNGQLVSVYSEAFKLTKNEEYKRVVFETLEWIEREMTSPEYGFYSSLDADSEGEEGKFYVWQEEELDNILGDNTEILKKFWNIKTKGNWEENNILYSSTSIPDFAEKNDIDVNEFENIVVQAKEKLLEEREKRERPGLDDKILTSWNALMLKGYVDAYKAFQKEAFKEIALKNGNFLLENAISKDNRINRNFKNGTSSINGFLDDYSFTIEAFIALYEITFDEKWLNKANDLTKYVLEHFYDENTGMFFYTSDLDKALVARKKETADNVIPASNSSMAKSLYLLSKFYYNLEYRKIAESMVANMQENIENYGPFYSNWAIVMDMMIHKPYEVAIVGEIFNEKRKALQAEYFPNTIYLGGKNEGSLELLEGKLQAPDTYIYVCQDRVCKMPVTDVSKAKELIVK